MLPSPPLEPAPESSPVVLPSPPLEPAPESSPEPLLSLEPLPIPSPSPEPLPEPLPSPTIPPLPNEISIDEEIEEFERRLTQEYEAKLEIIEVDEDKYLDLPRIRGILADISQKAGIKPAVIYNDKKSNSFVIFVVPAQGKPFKEEIPLQEISRNTSEKVEIKYRDEIAENVELLREFSRDRTIQIQEMDLELFYRKFIAPIEDRLGETDTLLFAVSEELRQVPFHALYDLPGQDRQFLVEKYASSIIPSVSLLEEGYEPFLLELPILAMGASRFTEGYSERLKNLPTVEQELSFLGRFFGARSFLNEKFTYEVLAKELSEAFYGILHFSTHAELDGKEGGILYFWREKLKLQELANLMADYEKPLELLVLNACETTRKGDVDMDMAELTLHAGGVKSVLATFWSVDAKDAFVLMTQFYENLHLLETEDGRTMTKAEALRQAQIAMIRGDVRIENGWIVRKHADREYVRVFPLFSEEDRSLEGLSMDLREPKYWAGFTMVGSPW